MRQPRASQLQNTIAPTHKRHFMAFPPFPALLWEQNSRWVFTRPERRKKITSVQRFLILDLKPVTFLKTCLWQSWSQSGRMKHGHTAACPSGSSTTAVPAFPHCPQGPNVPKGGKSGSCSKPRVGWGSPAGTTGSFLASAAALAAHSEGNAALNTQPVKLY